MVIKNHWVAVGAYGYLLLPFLIFCLGFLRTIISIPILIILCYVFYKLIERPEEGTLKFKKNELICGVLLIVIWVWLSGIGGFAFQNSDFHTRNAIFRDLVNYRWPVYYSGSGQNPTYTLIYYIGYWLPSALVGKIVGWNAGQVSLYIWTVGGIVLTVTLLRMQTKASIPLVILLMVFFSGMDVIGAQFIRAAIDPNHYPVLWPPIMHLEWWAGSFQYSSFTTQLFWVFNQAIPVWVCIALHLAFSNPRRSLFLLSLCFFFAPLPALGFIPFILLEIPQNTFHPENLSLKIRGFQPCTFLKNCWADLRPVASYENLVGGSLIFIISYLYFSANLISSSLRFFEFTNYSILVLSVFIPLEWFILWILFAKKQFRNLNWYFAGIILFICPLLVVGSGTDFVMRTSIPALFFLMVWSLEALVYPGKVYKTILIAVLAIGALTSLYEINRAVYRTTDFYFFPRNSQIQAGLIPQDELLVTEHPEKDHPNSLLADSFFSFGNIQPENAMNFVSDINRSYLLKIIFKQP